MRLAQALHAYGTPSHRLEEALQIMSAELDVEAQYLVTPTSIFASIGPEDEQLAAASFVVLFRARPADYGWILLGCATAFLTTEN